MRPSCDSTFSAVLALFVMRCTPLFAADVVFQDDFERHYGFQVQTPDIVVAAGDSATYCYYFRTPNTASLGIKRWTSHMTPGSHHLILFTTYDTAWTPTERQPAGTLTQTPCGISQGGGYAAWAYAAHNLDQSLSLPTDDGAGTPLAMEIKPDQPAFIQLYIINSGSAPLTASALLKAEALAPATIYTKSATYLTDIDSFAIAPNGSGTISQTCAVPSGTKFWWLSTRTHQFASESKIQNSGSDVVVSTDWAHPSVATFTAPSFVTFSGNGLTYQCAYNNPNNSQLVYGDNEATQELCLGIGYFFPATRPAVCFNSNGPL